MFRSICCALAVGLFAVLGAAGAADDTITLKDYEPKVGDRVRVTEEDRTTTRSVIVREDKREDKVERKVKVVVYVAETLAVKKGEKKPVRSKRTYERAEETTDGTTEKLPLHGLSVVIERKGDNKYAFTDENGKKLPQAAEGALEKEFAKKKEDSIDDFIPRRPLKVGETWKLDTRKLLADAVADKFTADEKRASGSGTLTRAYTFGGHRYAGFEIKMDIPLTGMNDGAKLTLKPGSSMSMHMAAEGNVAGTEPDGTAVMRMNMLMLFEVAGGVDASVRVEGLMTMHTEALPPRKRD